MKIDKFTKIEKAFLIESIYFEGSELEEELSTKFKVEGIYWVYNHHLLPILSIKIKDIDSGWIRYIPFHAIEIKSITPFKGIYKFIQREEKK